MTKIFEPEFLKGKNYFKKSFFVENLFCSRKTKSHYQKPTPLLQRLPIPKTFLSIRAVSRIWFLGDLNVKKCIFLKKVLKKWPFFQKFGRFGGLEPA